MKIQLGNNTEQRAILYFKESGTLLAHHVLDGKDYFLFWADYKNEVNIYVAAQVDAATIEAYLAGNLTHHQVHQQSPALYLGYLDGVVVKLAPITFAELEQRDLTPPLQSYYDKDLDPASEFNKG